VNVPRFGKGVKLREEPDGRAMLLIPEGALLLNEPAAAALALVDGKRTVDDIVASLVTRFEVAPSQARGDVEALFQRLRERRFIEQ
jgi:pyrroloquinoline quinone biosynthesis protein D